MAAFGYPVRQALRAGEARLRNLVTRSIVGRRCVESALPWRNYETVDSHVFFGYHDITPFHATDARLLAHRALLGASPEREPAEVGYFDQKTGRFTTLGKTDLWCWQMGARLRWMQDGRAAWNALQSGCGSESLLLAILGCDVTGLELKRQRLRTARQRLSVLEKMRGTSLACRFLEGSLFDDDLDLGAERFDVVWMEDTFHHLEPRNRVGARIADLVQPGGYLVIAETNALNPLVQLHLLLTRGLPSVRTFSDHRGRKQEYGVERVTGAGYLVGLFEKNGFVTELVRHERLFPNLGTMPRHLMALERFLAFLPRFAFVHYSYVGRSSE